MTEKEAFEAWYPGQIIPTDNYLCVREEGFYVVWQAACAYQRKKDAEICNNTTIAEMDFGFVLGGKCAQAIEEQ